MSIVVPFDRKVSKTMSTASSLVGSDAIAEPAIARSFDPRCNLESKQGPFATIRSHQERAPVPVTQLAEALGLPVFEEAGWPDDVSGLIERADPEDGSPSGYRIVINKAHVETRKRFTIAHEIAHYILHRDQIGDRLQDNALYRSKVSGKAEREANQLAADILMPRDLIEQAIEGEDIPSLDKLASAFNVSKVAMAIRLGVPTD